MIKVCDAIMGSGKTSAAIAYMNEHPQDKFVFVTPYLSEAQRIKQGCPNLCFVEPNNKIPEYGFKKVSHTESLINDGKNIATTHQAFKNYTPAMLEKIREQGYTLFIDESLDVVEEFSVHEDDLKCAVESGIAECVSGEYKLKNGGYEGRYFSELVRFMKSRNLIDTGVKSDEHTSFFWTLPPSLLKSFKYVFVLTYLFEGQNLCYYMRATGIQYEYIGVERTLSGGYRFGEHRKYVPEYVSSLRDKIHIVDHRKLNSIGDDFHALSVSWFERKDEKCIEQLKNNIINFYKNLTESNSEERLWTTFKQGKSKLSGKGYTKAFIPFNTRASNDYRHTTHLVYAANVFVPTGLKILFRQRGIGVDEDLYALSTMVQWVWRSAIRDGKEIYIYIPSRRMRRLFCDWIDDVSGKRGDDDGTNV